MTAVAALPVGIRHLDELAGPLADRCEDALCIDSPHTATIQEIHLIAIHLICASFDAALEAGGTR